MKPNIFVDRRLPQDVQQYLEAHCTIHSWKPDETRNHEALLQYLQHVEGFFTSGSAMIDESLLLAAPSLRVVSSMSVGYNHYDIDAMKRHGVIGTHTPYVLDDTVADLVMALMLSTARRIAELDSYIKSGKWVGNEGRKLFGLDVHHKKLGIIGMGRIGEVVAKRAKLGFDMEVSYYNRSRKIEVEQKYGFTYHSLEHILQHSDFVVMLAPLSESTKGMLGLNEFRMMKSTAIFINASRGSTIVEKDLIQALQERSIAGAGLDVFEQEPLPLDSPLLSLDNVVLAPHIGSATDDTRKDMAMMAARNLVHCLQGNSAAYIVPELQP